jgi:hypothetical protein
MLLEMTNLTKEPLVHFVLLGVLIFAFSAWSDRETADPDEIVVSQAQQENLARTFARTWRRAPTAAEAQTLLTDFLREQIAYRESKKLNLDQDDVIIRRRLRQKFELLTEELATLAPPTDTELKEWLDSHPDDFRMPAMSSLQQVYFSVDESSEAAEKDAASLLERLQADESSVNFDAVGDRSMLPTGFADATDAEIDSLFGGDFAASLANMKPGVWNGPVYSGFGVHLVKLQNRTNGRPLRLEEVRNSVAHEWTAARKLEAVDALYARLAENYSIRIESADASVEQ